MPNYLYKCESCGEEFEYQLAIKLRDLPTTHPCPKCSHFEVRKEVGCAGFTVPEGDVGNAANGYSSYHGDAENFKARDKGKPLPYPKGNK